MRMQFPMVLSMVFALGCTTSDKEDMGGNDLGASFDQGSSADQSLSADLSQQPDLTPPGPRPGFFITSTKGSANYGGLAGADARCRMLAEAANLPRRTWAAYLSATAMGGQPAVNARDRIGKGPWYNVKLEKIADNLTDLHDQSKNLIGATTGLDEKGMSVPTNEHDVVTGSTLDGMLNGTSTCANYTSESDMNINVAVGHFNRMGGGANPMSWNFAHASRGCSAMALISSAGAGRFYCFATD